MRFRPIKKSWLSAKTYRPLHFASGSAPLFPVFCASISCLLSLVIHICENASFFFNIHAYTWWQARAGTVLFPSVLCIPFYVPCLRAFFQCAFTSVFKDKSHTEIMMEGSGSGSRFGSVQVQWRIRIRMDPEGQKTAYRSGSGSTTHA